MKSLTRLSILGLLAGVLGYGIVFYAGTFERRGLEDHDHPELAWLKVEFELSEEEFRKISELHYAYLPRCEEMCELVATKNNDLIRMLGLRDVDQGVRDQMLDEVVSIKARCQRMMISHFYLVSQEMNPKQRERYLKWVLEESLSSGHESLVGGHHQQK